MFVPHKNAAGNVIPWEYLPAGAITPKAGMALVQSSGNMAIASGTTAPTYLSMIEKDSACTAGDIIPVIRVDHDTIYETTNQASFASIKRGDKVTLHTDGLQVTATKTNGVAEVVDFDDAAASGAGGKVWVRF
mgnify:CR=1 FL=1